MILTTAQTQKDVYGSTCEKSGYTTYFQIHAEILNTVITVYNSMDLFSFHLLLLYPCQGFQGRLRQRVGEHQCSSKRESRRCRHRRLVPSRLTYLICSLFTSSINSHRGNPVFVKLFSQLIDMMSAKLVCIKRLTLIE